MTAALEDVKVVKVESWKTLNTAAAPNKLDEGQTPNAKNVWVDEKPGSVITANGYKKVGTTPANLPVTFCIDYFKTSSGSQTFIVSDNITIWTTIDFQNFTQLVTGLSASFQLRGKVIRDKLWLTNGSDSVRVWDGSTMVILDGTNGTPDVPKGRYIEYHDERVWLYHIPSNRSMAQFSALTDSAGTIIAPDNASAWPASNTLQISEGDADFGTGMILYRGYLYFFKQYSIWRLAGYDEYTYTRVKTRASSGTRFNESIQVVDTLVHLIGVDGIYVFDGEEDNRISDIIDPSTASQTAFGFNHLQQPNTASQFWEVTRTADWNLGTVPTNCAIDNKLSLTACDETQTDFEAGATLTNIDTTTSPGYIYLARGASGGSHDRATTIDAFFDDSRNGAVIYGTPMSMIDNSTIPACGMGIIRSSSNRMVVTLDKVTPIGAVGFLELASDANITATVEVNTGTVQTKYGNEGTWVAVGTFQWAPSGSWVKTNQTVSFNSQNAIQVSIKFNVAAGSYQLGEIQAYTTAYATTGKFVSKTLTYPESTGIAGKLLTDIVDSGQTATFFTQTSADGINWDAEVNVGGSGVIASTLRKYIRWGVNFASDGSHTPYLSNAWLPASYLSEVHNTGGNLFAWGPYEADVSYNQQTVNFYYRTATSAAGVLTASWNLIVPGGVLSDSILNQYVQFKFEITSGNAYYIPTIDSVTINWVVGTGVQQATLQNVASVYWKNRYWLSAAGPSASANDTILIRGKKTFGSPWQLKDWSILSFTRFQDYLYGGSSTDGSIYQLDTGYSKDGAAMDSYFETRDFEFEGFMIKISEALVEVQRVGTYDLTVSVSTDQGTTWTDRTIDLTGTEHYIKKLNWSFFTEHFRMRVRINDVDKPFQVHDIRVFYRPTMSRGSLL